MPPSSVHLNGSINLADPEAVMREVSSRIPRGLRRMTDGETGERGNWIIYQIEKFRQMPAFEEVTAPSGTETSERAMPQLRLADGQSAAGIDWPNLGYADTYAASFALFERLRNEGVIADGVRFQMEYPTPMAPVASNNVIAPDDQPAVAISYEKALFADLDKALARLPHELVAVQWDVAYEFAALEGIRGPQTPLREIAPALARYIDHVPEEVPVGMHLCYGDYGHRHFKEPESLRMQVDLVNAVAAEAARPPDFVAFTVPQGRNDDEYFRPIRDLATGVETELNFSVVPYRPDDQPPGTIAEQIAKIDDALAQSPGGLRDWGVCTECGMGRAAADDVPRLLDLHRQLLEAGRRSLANR